MTDVNTPTTDIQTPISAQDLQRSASHGSLWTMVHTVLAFPLAFVANAIVARSLGAENYGRLAIITLIMGLAIGVSNSGVTEGIQQWGAAAHARGDTKTVDELLRKSLGFHLLVQLPLLVVTACILGHDQPLPVLGALLIAAIFPTVLGTSSLCISVENLTGPAAKQFIVINALTQVTVTAVAAISHSSIAVWSARSAVGAIALPANFIILSAHRRRVVLQPRLPKEMPNGFWKFCVLTAAGGILGILITSRSEILVLQHFSSPAAVGVYALAFGVAAQMRGPVEALLAPLAPSIAGIVEVHPELARATMQRCLRIGSLLSAALLLMVPLVTALFPYIYGNEFYSSAELLPTLAVVALSQAIVNPLLAFARAQKLSGLLLIGNLVALAIDLGIAVLAAPSLGAWGAVVATAAAQLTMVLLLASFQVRRNLLTWRDLVEANIPMSAATLVVGCTTAAASYGLETQLMTWMIGLAIWCCLLRRCLSIEARKDLEQVASMLPKPITRLGWLALGILGVAPSKRTMLLKQPSKCSLSTECGADSMSQLLEESDPIIDPPTLTRRPSIALIRGDALNPFEMQAYAPIISRFDLLGVGRRRPRYEVDGLPMPVSLLPAVAAYRTVRGLHRRSPHWLRHRTDPDRLIGLAAAVGDRDVLHAAETVLSVSEQAADLVTGTSVKLVLTCWETIPFRYDDNPVLAARKAKVRAATSLYIAVTERASVALLEEGVEPERIRVIPAAVDCQRFRPLESSPALRSDWGVPPGSLIVLYIGRLIQEKGVVELVRAFAATGDPQAHLVVIGNGDQQERIRICAQALGVADRVHIRPGLSYRLLPSVYATADIVVAPSLTTPYWEEQFGMVLAETMACGRPLVTTASGAIPEVVGDAAEVVQPYDVSGLTQALTELLSSPDRRQALSTAGRQRAETRYSVPVVAAQLAAAYDELLGQA
jgi:starch synthase